MTSRLAEILAVKRKEVEGRKQQGLGALWDGPPLPIRDFQAALSPPGKTTLIAEIKFASPSAGLIRERADPAAIGAVYAQAGARAISVLTDQSFFGGTLADLTAVKQAVAIPVLRKDFILDEIQVEESWQHGADALLLIARCLPGRRMRRLLDCCRERGLAALTEVHNRPDLFKALDNGADIIGINNRDLRTFQTDLRTTLGLAHLVPGGTILVSASGIASAGDIRRLRAVGVQAVLVGTALMGSPDLPAKTRELVAAGTG